VPVFPKQSDVEVPGPATTPPVGGVAVGGATNPIIACGGSMPVHYGYTSTVGNGAAIPMALTPMARRDSLGTSQPRQHTFVRRPSTMEHHQTQMADRGITSPHQGGSRVAPALQNSAVPRAPGMESPPPQRTYIQTDLASSQKSLSSPMHGHSHILRHSSVEKLADAAFESQHPWAFVPAMRTDVSQAALSTAPLVNTTRLQVVPSASGISSSVTPVRRYASSATAPQGAPCLSASGFRSGSLLVGSMAFDAVVQSPQPSRKQEGSGSISPFGARGRLLRSADEVGNGVPSPMHARNCQSPMQVRSCRSPQRSTSAVYRKPSPSKNASSGNIYAVSPCAAPHRHVATATSEVPGPIRPCQGGGRINGFA
jgi:hypothetical protein